MSIEDILRLTKELKALGVSAFKQGELYLQFASEINYSQWAEQLAPKQPLSDGDYQ